MTVKCNASNFGNTKLSGVINGEEAGKMHHRNSPMVLGQHPPNPRLLPSRRTRNCFLGMLSPEGFHPSHSTILTWKYIAIPSLSWGQNPETASLTALCVYLQLRDCSSSRRQLTATLSGQLEMGNKFWPSQNSK